MSLTAPGLPAKPTGFTATQTGNAEVTLNWDNPNDPNIVKYRVYVKKEGAGGCCLWRDMLPSNANTTSHTLTGRDVPTTGPSPHVLENGSTYEFRIMAVYEEQAKTSSYGEIPASDPVRVKLTSRPPAKPDLLTSGGTSKATTEGRGTVFLAWNNAHDEVAPISWTG